jgi:hypothetical protein
MKVVLESDYSNVINGIRDVGNNKSELVFQLKEIVSSSLQFSQVSFQFVSRKCNRVAHGLVHLAKRTVHSAVWRFQTPMCVRHLISRDCNPIS